MGRIGRIAGSRDGQRLALVALAASAAACAVDDRTIQLRQVDFTFNSDAQGWTLSRYDDGSGRNLAVATPDGGTAPALVFESGDGDHDSGAGSLKLTVSFTDFLQSVDAIVTLSAHEGNLSGNTLHANVKWVSGPIPPNGGLQLDVSAGPSFVFAGQWLDFTHLPLGQWVPLTFDPNLVTIDGFDASVIRVIGVQFYSAGPERGPLTAGDTVFEIDSVIDRPLPRP